jgi:hypothetical protein
MKIFTAILLTFVIAGSAFAQEQNGLVVQNPLDEINDALANTLEAAEIPFTEEQVQQIALVMDEQRRATEELFGQIFDFSGGPPQGAQLDQALAGIAWMTEAFLENVDDVLTLEQSETWMRARQEGTVPASARFGEDRTPLAERGGGTSRQIAQIRINNNPYTAETLTGGGVRVFFGGGGRGSGGRGGGRGGGGNGNTAEVITRGGVGDYHGNVNFTFQNHLLNARNPFASNRPDYLQRNLNAGFNGPIIPGRLTIDFSVNQNNVENVDTISAVTPSGIVSEGITRPNLQRRFSGNGQLQLSDQQAIHFAVTHFLFRRKNEGIGGITLRERARSAEFDFLTFNVRSLTQFSSDTVLDTRITYTRNNNENHGVTQGQAINVKDSFQSGGATNSNEGLSRTVSLNSLLIHTGDWLTFKAGFDLQHLSDRSLTEDGFNGEFEFASLDDFLAGMPTRYTVSTGNPLLEFTQTEGALFVQNDVRVSRRLTLMFGLRYEAQSNLDDWDNLDPRFGYAYAINDSTVLRGGVGLFHNRFFSNNVESLLRLDGTRQQELVVTNPSYPNPFLSGKTRVIPPSSIRVRSSNLEAQSEMRGQISLERQLPGNVQATLSYNFNRSANQYRSVNLNAPRPGQFERPDPTQGNILELRSTGRETAHELAFEVQQRLRFMTISGEYEWSREMNDSQGTFSLPSNNYDLSADWARSNDRIHRFEASVNAQLPLGIFMTVEYQANSGQPYTITTGRDNNNDTVSNDRPAGITRNSELGPGFQSTTVNLSKVFFLRRDTSNLGREAGGAGAQINLFANITNALNRSNLQRVSGALTSWRFGQPTSAGDPREIEIGVRFQF